MRILLDECLPRRLGRELVGHEVTTVAQAGWSGLTNGALVARIGAAYDAFVTVDRNLSAQQNLSDLAFGVIVLRAPSNRLDALKPLVPALLTALGALQPGELVRVPPRSGPG